MDGIGDTDRGWKIQMGWWIWMEAGIWDMAYFLKCEGRLGTKWGAFRNGGYYHPLLTMEGKYINL